MSTHWVHFDCGGTVTLNEAGEMACDRCHAHAHRLDTRHPSDDDGTMDRDTETAYLLRLPTKCVDIDAAMKERHLRMHGGMMFGDENDAASGDERHDAIPRAQAATSPSDSGNVCQEHAARCRDCGAPAVEEGK